MDGMYAGFAGAKAGIAMDGMYAGFAGAKAGIAMEGMCVFAHFRISRIIREFCTSAIAFLLYT